jgi:gas vesicle structural protein
VSCFSSAIVDLLVSVFAEHGLPARRDAKHPDAGLRNARTGKRVPVAIARNGTSANYLQRAPSPSGLAEVLDVILDKGLVIDAYVRVSVIGIEVLTIDARIVIASVDTYLRFAEAVNRLDLTESGPIGLPELREGAAKEVTEHKIDEAQEKVTPDSPSARSALKGVAAGAVAAGAAAVAKTLVDRARSDDGEDEESEGDES